MAGEVALIITNGQLAGRKYPLDGSRTFSIGRASDCDVAIPDDHAFQTVSRHHCLLDVDLPRIRARDAGSRNGTHLNGMQIGRPAVWHLRNDLSAKPARAYDLHHGDELELGGLVFRVNITLPADLHSGGASL